MGDEGSEICVTEKKNIEEREVVVMDTPERSKTAQIATSIAKFEESPVFNFLNNLSPIKPVKSMHISQSINPLSFASLPAVFTSPHVRSLRESRFLRSHQFSDPSKPEFSSDDGGIVDNSKVSMEAIKELNEKHGNLDRRASDCELAVVPFVEDASQREGFYRNEENTEIVTEIDQNNEASSCDWECLISDASDLLVFESPNNTESYEKSIDPETTFYRSMENEMQNILSVGAVAPGEQVGEGSEPENLSTQPGEGIETMEIGEAQDIVAGQSVNHPSEKMDFEHLSGFYRGMRRRCLVFEMGGARTRRVDENSGSDSSMLLQSDGNTSFNDQPLVPTKTGNDSSRRVLPGIGLHLNALATTPRDYKIGNCEASAPGRVLVGPISSANFHPPSTSQELFNNTLALASLEREIDSNETDVLPVEDACPISELLANEEINQNSPKKKRRRMEQAEETGACKRCNCKKSKCLKLYCECFAAGVYCVEPCACIDCFNKPIHEDTVLATRKQIESRNPLAFAPKVIRSSDSVPETGDDSSKTPASARHKRGCNCKKSGCLKKYCECYQGGVGCSINCRCEGCKNAFGRKDGSCVIHTELQLQEDETGASEKTALQEEFDHNMDSVPPATPLLAGRQLSQQPFSSKKKPPKSSFPSIASSSSSFYGNQSFAKPSFFQPPPKFDKRFETVAEDEIPDFLQESSPIGGIKSSSPNGKRVSPPHGVRLSPGLKSNRKLILQSIPSFPSLTSNQ